MPEPFETPWHILCPKIKDYHETMIAMLGKGGPKVRGWTITDTASHFNIALSTVSENLKLADALECGKIDSTMSRDRARRMVLNYKVKMRAWSAKIKDDNMFYLRDDTGLPYLFTLKLQAEAFCEVVKNVEPAMIEITLLRDRDLEKGDDA